MHQKHVGLSAIALKKQGGIQIDFEFHSYRIRRKAIAFRSKEGLMSLEFSIFLSETKKFGKEGIFDSYEFFYSLSYWKKKSKEHETLLK